MIVIPSSLEQSVHFSCTACALKVLYLLKCQELFNHQYSTPCQKTWIFSATLKWDTQIFWNRAITIDNFHTFYVQSLTTIVVCNDPILKTYAPTSETQFLKSILFTVSWINCVPATRKCSHWNLSFSQYFTLYQPCFSVLLSDWSFLSVMFLILTSYSSNVLPNRGK